ncbi:MAG: universal stress protein [Legionella sp.]|nr:MAG: universal stress protein [Legionella sp.]
MFKKIVVATDFSKHARYALNRAMQIAELFQAELTCIHVVQQNFLDNFKFLQPTNEEKHLQDHVKKVETSFHKELKKMPNQYPVRFIVCTGRVSDQINQYVDNNGIDLVLMGAHGTYYLNDYILGTSSESVIKHANIPVQLIKKNPEFSYERILVTTDFSESSRKATETAYQLYPNAQFLLLHVSDVWYEKKNGETTERQSFHDEMHHILQNKLMLFIKKAAVDPTRFVPKYIGGYPPNDIVECASTWNAQLVVAGTRGHSALHYILIGSVTNRLLRMCQTDILIVP